MAYSSVAIVVYAALESGFESVKGVSQKGCHYGSEKGWDHTDTGILLRIFDFWLSVLLTEKDGSHRLHS